jgi:hypothetical protein
VRLEGEGVLLVYICAREERGSGELRVCRCAHIHAHALSPHTYTHSPPHTHLHIPSLHIHTLSHTLTHTLFPSSLSLLRWGQQTSTAMTTTMWCDSSASLDMSVSIKPGGEAAEAARREGERRECPGAAGVTMRRGAASPQKHQPFPPSLFSSSFLTHRPSCWGWWPMTRGPSAEWSGEVSSAPSPGAGAAAWDRRHPGS